MSEERYALYWIPRQGKAYLTDEKKFMNRVYREKSIVREAARNFMKESIYNDPAKGSFFYKDLNTNRFTRVF